MRRLSDHGNAILRAALATGLALAAGCAASRIDLPRFDVATEVGSGSAVVAGARVGVEPFALPRAGRDATALGSGYSGVSKRPATIHLSEPIDAFVVRTLQASLASAGVEPAERGVADATIVGTISAFSVNEHSADWGLQYSAAEVAFRAALTDRSGAVLWSADLEGHAESGRVPDATTRDRATLEQAVREAVGAMMRDEGFWRAIQSAAAATRHTAPGEAF